MIYFTSDTHFWHRAIITYCNRPWPDQETMNAGLIERWNSRIKATDTVYHLGDFAFCGAQKAIDIYSQLRGTKILIKGNHDSKQVRNLPWDGIYDYYVHREHILYEDDEGNIQQFHQPIVLMHFPILSWDGMAHGAWHLHGHCHGSLPDNGSFRMDVGVDTNDWYPYSIDDIRTKMALRSVVPVDHHR